MLKQFRRTWPDPVDQKYEPEHRDKKFKSKTEFGRWLSITSTHEIHFADEGQDALIWYIDKGGEVLHCEPFQASVWNGVIVDLEALEIGNYIKALSSPHDTKEEKSTRTYTFTVLKIVKTKR